MNRKAFYVDCEDGQIMIISSETVYLIKQKHFLFIWRDVFMFTTIIINAQLARTFSVKQIFNQLTWWNKCQQLNANELCLEQTTMKAICYIGWHIDINKLFVKWQQIYAKH